MPSDLPINLFDGAVVLFLVLAMLSGFRTGLMRSLVTILAYTIAAPAAVVLLPRILPLVNAQLPFGDSNNSVVLFALFLVIGFILSALMRGAIGDVRNGHVGLFDRVAGAMLGAARIILVAVLIVMVFDRLIPAGQEPAFLTGSKLRPVLSQAGSEGLRQLPPELAAYIDRIKHERGL